MKIWGDRVELLSGFGGINAWQPENASVEPGRGSTSFNDAWLAQGWVGGRAAVDHDRHLWLATEGRYLSNFGTGKKRSNIFDAGATFYFGRQ